jgi:FKBP-type peptidyl-prolyl cis-trans isomerase SlyD
MAIGKNKVVRIEYLLTDPDGQVLDSSKQRGPLTYLHGLGNLIPALEAELEGKEEGEEVILTLNPEQAYGQKDEQLVQQVPRSMFQHVDNLEEGMRFEAQTDDGSRVVTVVGVDEENVTVDANHPLAGIPLHFNVNVVEVRDATEQEVNAGQAEPNEEQDSQQS